MSPENEKLLCERYPLIFKGERSAWGIAVGDGWFDLLDTTCALLYASYDRARERYAYLRSIEGTAPLGLYQVVDAVAVEKARLAVVEAAEQVPRAEQVKEKYGTLRFYVQGGTEQTLSYIDFAEHLSGRVCETCGKPGKRRPGGWIRTLCDEHAGLAENRLTA